MLDRIGQGERPAGAVRKGLKVYGATDLEKRLPPPYARAY
jgi:hypothetical protein